MDLQEVGCGGMEWIELDQESPVVCVYVCVCFIYTVDI